MTTFIAAYKNETFKLLRRKKYLVFLILGLVICGLAALSSVIAYRLAQASSVRLSNFTMNILPFFADFYMPLIIFMATTDLFCSEQQEGSLKASLIRPVSRLKLYGAKTLAVVTIGAITLVCVFVFTTLCELAVGGIKASIVVNFLSYTLDLVPLYIVVLMAALINQISKNPTLAMFLCVLIYAALKLSYVFANFTNGFFFTDFMQWHRLWIGITLPVLPLLTKVALLLSYGAVFFFGGLYLFEKKEV